MRLFLWLSIVVALCFSVLGDMYINEIMYNPPGHDDNLEFVEITHDPGLNLSGYTVGDENSNDTLVSLFFVSGSFSLIVEEGFNHSGINASIYSVGPAIGDNLNNDEDTITLYDPEGVRLDQVHYTKDQGGSNNRTLERRQEGTWGESLVDGGTPGAANSIDNLSIQYEDLVISEVYPNSFEDDAAPKPSGEWVELYNVGTKTIDLRGLFLTDTSINHKLYLAWSTTLAESLFLGPQEYIIIYRNGDPSFSLNNNGYEEVWLMINDEDVADFMSYDSSVEGMSWSNVEGDWYLTPPSPGEGNLLDAECDWLLELDIDNAIYQQNDLAFELRVARYFGFPEEISVKGKIEDLDGRIIKEYAPWTEEYITSDRHQQYTPRLQEGIYQISFWIEPLPCAEAAPIDNSITKLIAINPHYKENQSTLAIGTAYLGNDNSAEWGDQFRVKVDIYKGDETREAVQLWAERDGEKIGPTTKINIYDPYQRYPLTLPIQLFPNCNGRLADGKGTLILDAFGLRATAPFTIAGIDQEICTDYLDYVDDQQKSSQSTARYEIIDAPSSISAGDILPLTVQLINEDQPHQYRVWSYLYRGNKCYSCAGSTLERDHNAETRLLREDEAQTVDFLLQADREMQEGEYNLKVKIRKDQQKTAQEITKTVTVISSVEPASAESSLSSFAVAEEDEREIVSARLSERKNSGNGIIVYESNSQKARNLIPYVLISMLVLLCAVLLQKQI